MVFDEDDNLEDRTVVFDDEDEFKFEGGYNRQGYIGKCSGLECTICGKIRPGIVIDSSEGEYKTPVICVSCLTAITKQLNGQEEESSDKEEKPKNDITTMTAEQIEKQFRELLKDKEYITLGWLCWNGFCLLDTGTEQRKTLYRLYNALTRKEKDELENV